MKKSYCAISHLTFALSLAATLVACGSDSGSSAEESSPQKENIVSGYEEHAGPAVTDSRDGLTYKTVVIGNQTWMAENLNVVQEDGVESFCYNNDPAMCQKYGRLYTWAAAMKACPEGWRLPTISEWQTLLESVGGTKSAFYDDEWDVAGNALKAIDGWKDLSEEKRGGGIDSFGFAALPGSFYDASGGKRFEFEGTHAAFWASTENFGGRAGDCMALMYNTDMARLTMFEKNFALSVRCLKD